MRDLDFDHVTPFRPITMLNFRVKKFLRGYHYKNYKMEFVIYGRDLSHMGSEKIHLGFVKYGLGFVTYGDHPPYVTNPAHIWQTHLWRLRNGYIYIHIYISITEASKMGLSFMGGVCHIWGQRRYIWVLSNMGWVLSLMGSIPILTNPTPWWQTPIHLSR